ncbi:MAG: AEC family transporter [Micrococcus sp.]|nr:AEC family transporter [Micrococcus sp.]
MQEVLAGFLVIWVIIAVGFVAGRTGVLGENGRVVLSRTAFFIGSPALLFTTLATADVAAVLGPQMLIALTSAYAAFAVFLVASRLLVPERAWSERIFGAMGASQVNSANLGLPIAAYVLGDAALAAPVILFQLAIYTPIYVTAIEASLAAESRARSQIRRGRRSWQRSVRAALRQLSHTLRNPLVLGSLLGLLASATGFTVPGPLWDSIELIGGLSIPAMLIAFGMSLAGARPLRKEDHRRTDVALASIIKLGVHPALAWVIASVFFGFSGHALLVAVVMAALPTAQNVYVAAVRYAAGEVVAKDTVLVTTILAIPAMVLVAVLLA